MKRLLDQLRKFCPTVLSVWMSLLAGLFASVPVLAAQSNVLTGDRAAGLMPIMVGLLIVSALVVAGFIITGVLKKDKRK